MILMEAQMKVNDIIVLENASRYILMQETILNNEKYFLSVGVDYEEKLNYRDLLVFKLIIEQDGDYVETVVDEAITKKLMKIF